MASMGTCAATMLRIYWVRLIVLTAALWEVRSALILTVRNVYGGRIDDLFDKPPATVLPIALLIGAAFLGVYLLAAKLVERRRVLELAPGHAIRDLAVGMGFGIALFSILLAVIAAQGFVSTASYQGFRWALSSVMLFFVAAAAEELLFRGIVFRIAEESVGTVPTLILSSLLFASAHLGNNGITVLAIIAIVFGGLAAALTYCATRSLWAPIGAHFGWNFAQGAVFGTSVSGHDPHGILRIGLSGPSWATGGDFGPENTIYAIIIMLATSAVLAWRVRRAGNLIPLRFRMLEPSGTGRKQEAPVTLVSSLTS